MPFPYQQEKDALVVSLILVTLVSSGCSPSGGRRDGGFVPIANGFGFGQHSKGTYPGHRAIWADFEYCDTNGVRTTVWPSLNSVDSVQVNNGLVVFLGDKSYTYRNGTQGQVPRVIAFEAPSGPPMDISNEILRKWASKSDIEFTDISQDSLIWLTKTNDALRLDFGIVKRGLRGPGTIDALGAFAIISWEEARQIMQKVRKEGKLKKEQSSGIDYLEIE
jgi:hypothetical protein